MQPDQPIEQPEPMTIEGESKKEIYVFGPSETTENEASDTSICIYDYGPAHVDFKVLERIEETFTYREKDCITWMNLDGISKQDVEAVCKHYSIHPLLQEDILSTGQRPKMDEIEGVVFCLLNMLYFNDKECAVEQEQISIALGGNFVITFQDDATRDVFNSIREKLKLPSSKIRHKGADYLCYSLLDTIVDHYFEVMQRLGDKIEDLEEEIIKESNKKSLTTLNNLRKELLVLKRNVSPVRDLVNGFVKSESELLDENVKKYFKDVYDHIIQADDEAENYREIMVSIQDLYLNQVNLKMNEVMKVMAIVTCLLAPASVIGGIFGMNFDVIPITHQKWGFFLTVSMMLFIPAVMLVIFKKRRWF